MGNSVQDYATLCAFLVRALDTSRATWFAKLREFLADSGLNFVNCELNSDVVIESATTNPPSFPFNEISAETVEAALIAFQVRVATTFAAENNYIQSDDAENFMNALVAAGSEHPRWRLAFLTAAVSESLEVMAEGTAQAVAYFRANESTRNDNVARAAGRIQSNGMVVLAGFTQIGVAAVFRDQRMMRVVRERMGFD